MVKKIKYYSEEDTRDLRLALEDRVLNWSKVTTKKMFGCPCYQVMGKIFIFLVTKGIVITQLTEVEIDDLSQKYETGFFQAGKKIVKKWIRLSIEPNDLDKIMSYVRKSYESALQNK